MFRLIPRMALGLALLYGSAAWADALEASIAQQQDMDAEARASQQTIDALDDETRELLAAYRELNRETRSLSRYNEQLARQIDSQLAEMSSLREQLEQITDVSREVVPLMLRMIATLERFISLDLPFLLEERQARVASLRSLMDRADVSSSEKYRRIIEAYQVELEYARSIEAYQGPLAQDGESRSVEFLRIGRIALLYQTLDAQETGFFDPQTAQWQALDEAYAASVRQGLRIARKQAAPEILTLPVAAPSER